MRRVARLRRRFELVDDADQVLPAGPQHVGADVAAQDNLIVGRHRHDQVRRSQHMFFEAPADQGVRLADRLGLRQRLGELLVTRAVALHELGRYDAAARDLRRAETLVSPADRPELLFQLANLDLNRGRLVAAAAVRVTLVPLA